MPVVIPGDGIGVELVPEGVKALRAAGSVHGFELAGKYMLHID